MKTFYLYLAIVAVAVLEMTVPSGLWAYLSLVLFLLFFRRLYETYRVGGMLLVPIMLSKLLLLVSLIFIGAGFYVKELDLYASNVTFSGYFCLLACLYLHVSAAMFSRLWMQIGHAHPVPAGEVTRLLFVVLSLGISLYSIWYLLTLGRQQGFPLLTGTDRFVFLASVEHTYNIIITAKPIMAAGLGASRYLLSGNRAEKLTITGTFVLFTLTIVLFGEKFLSLIVFVFLFYLPRLLTIDSSKRLLNSSSVAVLAGLGVLVGALVLYIYSGYGTRGFYETMEALFGRFTGQGQVWYSALHDRYPLLSVDRGQISRLIDVGMSASANDAAFQSKVGVFYFINKYAAQNVYVSFMAQSGVVQFTGAFEAYMIVLFGHLPVPFIVMLYGIITGLSLFYVCNAYESRSVYSVMAAVFVYQIVYSVANQGAVWQLFGVKALTYIAVLLIIDFAHRLIFRGLRRSPQSRSIKAAPKAAG